MQSNGKLGEGKMGVGIGEEVGVGVGTGNVISVVWLFDGK